MSRMEHHVGRAREICKKQNTFKEKYDHAIENFGLTPHEDDPDWDNHVGDENFFYLEDVNRLFHILNNEENEYGHTIIRRVETPSGEVYYDYTLSFYNGGGGFDEVFEDTFKKTNF